MGRSPHIRDLIASRRALLGGLAGLPLLDLAACAATARGGAPSAPPPAAPPAFASVTATNADTVTLPPGYRWRTLIAWGDALFDSVPAEFDPDALTRAQQEQRFGQNNDMLALFPARHSFPPAQDQERMILCANLEYFDPSLMFPGVSRLEDLTPAHIEACMAANGVAVVALERTGGEWRTLRDAAPGAGLNRRITPFTPMVFSGPAAGHPRIRSAAAFVNAREHGLPHEPNPPGAVRCGTYGNCAGGQTPWGTYLSSEEGLHMWFTASDPEAQPLREALQDQAFAQDCRRHGVPVRSALGRLAPAQFDMSQNPHGPALYGWVVEIDPYDPTWAPRKRTALGRKKGECATTALTRDGRVAVYMGDDSIDEHVYKFVSRRRFDPSDRLANRDLLDDGQLYAARFEADGSGRWLPLTLDRANAAARAQNHSAPFADAGDVLVRAREAAGLLGATPMDRPEDVEALLDANWVGLGPVLVVCTNKNAPDDAHPGNPRRESPEPGQPQANAAGHILRIDEAGGDSGAASFTWDVFALCGDPNSDEPVAPSRTGRPVHVSTQHAGVNTFSGDRFACPDNICFDRNYNVWIATDDSDSVFRDCNDSVLVTPTAAPAPRPVKRFLVGPVGAEICGPTMAPDERAFFAAIQHPGQNNTDGVSFFELRWRRGEPPPSHFPDGGDAWPRSAVIVVTREDGGRIGD